jgi:RNA polymerase sigma-19 factor, ECF subfamily
MKEKSSSLLASFASKAAEHYSAELHRFLARRMHRPQEVEDLVQEVYVRLLKVDDGEFVRNPRAYILQTASHVFHDFFEKESRAQQHVVADSEMVERITESPSDLQPCQLAQRLSTEEQLKAVLATLKPIHASVLLMFYRDGYSYEEIAVQLKASVRQVKRYIANAKVELVSIDWKWE